MTNLGSPSESTRVSQLFVISERNLRTTQRRINFMSAVSIAGNRIILRIDAGVVLSLRDSDISRTGFADWINSSCTTHCQLTQLSK